VVSLQERRITSLAQEIAMLNEHMDRQRIGSQD